MILSLKARRKKHILQETFENLTKSGLKLNPEKCIFGIKKVKLLGCLVSTKGIEVKQKK